MQFTWNADGRWPYAIFGKCQCVYDGAEYRAYASWEKGSVENCNRFVRRWYPKGTDFGRCTRADMHRLERVINSIHRRLLGGKTAYEYDTAFAKAA